MARPAQILLAISILCVIGSSQGRSAGYGSSNTNVNTNRFSRRSSNTNINSNRFSRRGLNQGDSIDLDANMKEVDDHATTSAPHTRSSSTTESPTGTPKRLKSSKNQYRDGLSPKEILDTVTAAFGKTVSDADLSAISDAVTNIVNKVKGSRRNHNYNSNSNTFRSKRIQKRPKLGDDDETDDDYYLDDDDDILRFGDDGDNDRDHHDQDKEDGNSNVNSNSNRFEMSNRRSQTLAGLLKGLKPKRSRSGGSYNYNSNRNVFGGDEDDRNHHDDKDHDKEDSEEFEDDESDPRNFDGEDDVEEERTGEATTTKPSLRRRGGSSRNVNSNSNTNVFRRNINRNVNSNTFYNRKQRG